MKMTLTHAAVLAGLAAFSSPVLASDGSVNLSGEINVQTCSINGSAPNGNNDFTVTIPKVSMSSLAVTGSTTGDTPFSFTLTGCAPTSGNVRAEFANGATVAAPAQELNTTYVVGGASTPIRIIILNADKSKISVGLPSGSQNSAPVAFTGGAVTLNYFARLTRGVTLPALNPGAFTTSVVYQLVYN
ncbi:MAG: fimbrial protein [Moraxellaceae bacterium]|nr:fimbrial protein [Moraxellaceae bacterium]